MGNDANTNVKVSKIKGTAPSSAASPVTEAQATVTQPVTEAQATVTQPVTEAQATVTQPIVPSVEDSLRAEIKVATEALASVKADVAGKVAAGDYTSLGDSAKTIASLEAKIADAEVRLTSRTFAPTVAQALLACIAGGTLSVPSINGRIAVQAIFDGNTGTLLSVTPFSVDSPRTLGATAPSVASVARANLTSATLDPRQPSTAGFLFRFSRDVEGSCEILSLGNGAFRGIRADGLKVEGTLNTCVQKLCNGISTDAYAKCNLGDKGKAVWDDATPPKGWTKVG